jgi:hypothetical protein
MGIVDSCCVDVMLLQWLVFNERLADVRIHSLLLLSSIAGCNTLCRVTIVLDVEDKFNVFVRVNQIYRDKSLLWREQLKESVRLVNTTIWGDSILGAARPKCEKH